MEPIQERESTTREADALCAVGRSYPSTGLTYGVAEAVPQVISAWRMVYMAYRRAGLIENNRHRIHTAPQAVGAQATVITATIGPVTVSTLTAITDLYGSREGNLPLDRVYHGELQGLRREGRTLMEVGLFADRRKQLSRTAEALFELMRFAFYFGLQQRVTDFVIGVHPRHARFYTRAFGFFEFGATKVYPAVKNRPVVLLRGDLQASMARQPLHPALEYFARSPVESSLFNTRCRFDPAEVSGCVIADYLRDREQEQLNLNAAG